MATPLEKVFSADEKAMVQADLKLIESIIESLFVELIKISLNNFSLRAQLALNRCENRNVSKETSSLASSRLLKEKLPQMLTVDLSTRHTFQPLLGFM